MTYPSPLKIGILGTGNIGKTLSRRLSAAGHQVKVANSRGPETIDPETLATGATPVKAVDAVSDVDVIILSMPLSRLPQIAPVIRHLPDSVIVADTSNYYPHRDGKIDEIEAGQPESLWVSDLLGRGVIKAWNAIGSGSFASKDRQPGAPDRIAIPVAGDNEADRKLIMQLVSDTGFDGYDAGTLTLSRQNSEMQLAMISRSLKPFVLLVLCAGLSALNKPYTRSERYLCLSFSRLTIVGMTVSALNSGTPTNSLTFIW